MAEHCALYYRLMQLWDDARFARTLDDTRDALMTAVRAHCLECPQCRAADAGTTADPALHNEARNDN